MDRISKVFSWNLVTIARRTHLYPYRTQKLSSVVLMILGGQLPGKVGSRWGKYSSLAQSVEHAAVNRVVVGSSPTGGAIWPVGQAVKTPPFHGGITSSILVRVTNHMHTMCT